HQHRAVTRLQVARQLLRAGGVLAVERMDRRVLRQARAQRGDLRRRILVLVQLAQQHHRLRAGAFGQRQVALDASGVEVAVQPGQHQHVVDIGGDQLALVALARGGARQHAAARSHADDVRRRAVGHLHEIAHHRSLGGVDAALEEAAVRLRAEQCVAIVQFITGAMLRHHPRQAQAAGRQAVAAPADMPQPLDRFALHCITLLASTSPAFAPFPTRKGTQALAPIIPSAHLADVRYEIRGALTRRARELESAGRDIIKLNIGNPGRYGFEAPAHLREAIASHLHESDAYGHEQGLEAAREAIAAQQRSRGARHVQPERIFIGNGVSELIDLALRALLQPGDEVLLPSPDYPLWSAATILNGGKPRYYRCLASHAHLPDPDEVEALITPPTRAVYPRALLQRLVDIAARHRLLLLADEIYDEILYDDATFQPLAELAGELPCLSFGGLSKVHRACGYRVGWMSLSGEPARSSVYRDALQLLAALRLCPNVTAQWAVLPALQDAPTIGALTAPGGRLH